MGSVHAEFVKAIVTYSNTGDRPHDKFFNHATKDPKFAQEHPKFAGFMTTAHRVGELPLGHFWEKMEHNFLSHPIRFEANHCGYIVEAIKKDLALPTITEYNDIPPYMCGATL